MLLAGLAACTDDVIELPGTNGGDNPTEVPDGYYFVLDTDVPQGAAQTRVAYANDNHSYFEEDDRLGIYTFDAEGNLLEPHNAEYRVLNVTNVETGNIRQVLENVNPDQRVTRGHHYVIYYPYIKDMYLDRLQNLTYGVHSQQQLAEVEHAQLSGTVSGYEVSDLLWDVATDQMTADGTTHYAEIHLDHAMANIILNIGEEYLPATRPEEGYEAYVLNSPRRATGINLTNGLAETDNWGYNVNRQSAMTPIRMWNSGLGSSGAQQFRASIPACQTIPSGTPLLQITTNEGTKQFKLKADLALRPGKNYVFTVMKQNTDPDAPIVPDVTDDDSWVLDVLDPETGRPVGLLCREYLRYQPQNSETGEADAVTGTKVLDGTKLAINSQAWVFYNLQADGKTPELSKGTVLRFIYDVRINNGELKAEQAPDIWPLPHTKSSGNAQGLYTPEHGFKWIVSPTKAPNGEDYGISSSEIDETLLIGDLANAKEENYYMHGGTIIWNGTEDKIEDFTPLITGAPTNAEAKANGHIAIDAQTGKATVSYATINDQSSRVDGDGKKIGVLIPRNLIDTRINRNGQERTNLYPLVKIGFNQFWISKSFRAITLTDGTTLPCYNKAGDPNGTTVSERKPAATDFPVEQPYYLDMGYIYPFAQNVDTDEGETTNYDPYNDPTEMAGPQGTEWDNRPSSYRPAPLYNKPAVEDERFVPLATESHYEYLMPTVDEFSSMMTYFGYAYAAKLCTREVSRTTGDKQTAYSMYTTLMRGETRSSGTYPANISGFNLRPTGYYTNDGGMSDLSAASEGAALILKSQATVNPKSVAYITFQTYDPWSTTNIPDFFEEENTFGNWQDPYTYFFAQVRLFMRFKNPTAGGTSVSYHTRSASPQQPESRNVYVPLEEME